MLAGYCYGARHIVDYALALLTRLKAITISHQSFLIVPQNREELFERGDAEVPLLISSCETDPRKGPERQEIGDRLLSKRKYKPGYKQGYWSRYTHGFAVRFETNALYLRQVLKANVHS